MNKSAIFKKFVVAPVAIFFRKANPIAVLFYEELKLIYSTVYSKGKGESIKFFCPNKMTLWRAQSLMEKEPDTIEWINGFSSGEILYDVGANIGCYSLYAARQRRMQVYAFEPESQNYALLNKNIYLNQLDFLVHAFNIALSSQLAIGELNLGSFEWGAALHNFGEAINYKKEKFNAAYRQSVLALPLDYLVFNLNLPFPDHIKIDVDGLEKEVIYGATRLLSDKRLKSILVELNEGLSQDMELIEHIKAAGFNLKQKYHNPLFDRGEFSRIYNYIFTRNYASSGL